MGLSGFVGVAIGLMFMYLVLSLICTTLNEIIATFLKWRAKSLSSALTEIIDNKDVRTAFYNFGLVATAKIASHGGGSAPQSTAASDRGLQADSAGKPKDPQHPSYIDSKSFALALIDSLSAAPEAAGKQQNPKNFPTIDDVKAIVEALPDSNIRDVVVANLATAGPSIASLRDNLASWFDTVMDRLSGDYQRWLKGISLAVGIVVAFAFNADSISVGRALWGDESLRNQTVTAATQYLDKPPAASQCKQENPAEKTKCLLQELKQEEDLLRPFPIGWPGNASQLNLLGWFLKLLGCLWTGLALSLGAPFWFDLLKKFMNVRGTGPNPAEKKG